MKLIIISGQSSTGKTTIAKQLIEKYQYTYFLKDDYKEAVYEQFDGKPPLTQWLRIERQSWQAMYQALQAAMRKEQSYLIEGNFTFMQRRQLKKIIDSKTVVVEIFCHAEPGVVISRYKNRYQSGNRHRGHRDGLWLPFIYAEGIATKLHWNWVRPLRLSHNALMLDTTNFDNVNVSSISNYINHCK